jgi:hypothetical protein
MGASIGLEWCSSERIQTQFTPKVVLANSDSSGLILGREGSSERRARALVVTNDGAHEFSFDQPGWFVAGARSDNQVAAALATAGPEFWLVRSGDGGVSWSAPEASSALTVTHVAIIGADVWALGVQTLGRWRGGEWQEMPSPVEINSIHDRVVGFGVIPVLLTSSGLYLWNEEREEWVSRAVGGRHIKEVSFPFFVSQRAGELVEIGKLQGSEVVDLGTLQLPANVHAFSWGQWPNSENRAVQMVVRPTSADKAGAVVIVRSADTGGFAIESLSIPGPDWVGISGATGLLAMSVDRRIVQYR